MNSLAEADLQVRTAHEFIAAKAPNPGAALFAVPYGSPNAWFVDEYLPANGPAHGTIAAVTGEPGVLHEKSNRWRLPRFTFGVDWRAPEGLQQILAD